MIKRTKFHSLFCTGIALLCVSCMASAAGPISLNSIYTPLLGTSESKPFVKKCAPWKRITGVELSVGDADKKGQNKHPVVQKMRLRCTKPGGANSWGGDHTYTGWTYQSKNKMVGFPARKNCPKGQYVSAIKIQSRKLYETHGPRVVARIGLECHTASQGRVKNTKSEFGIGSPRKGKLSKYTKYKHCTSGGFANGVYGFSDWVVDGIGLVCDPPYPTSSAKKRPILLVHGFGVKTLFENGMATPIDGVMDPIDCNDYFKNLLPALQTLRKKFGRTYEKISYYHNDKNCGTKIGSYKGSTKLKVIADALAQHIKTKYTQKNIEIDIIAHSMGGMIVRKALDDHGANLRVRKVVTMATPHAGAKGIMGATTCAMLSATIKKVSGKSELNHNCVDMLPQSNFVKKLEHNPQAKNKTDWLLVSTKWDWVVGGDSGHQMSRQNSSKPAVKIYKYNQYIRDRKVCPPLTNLAPYNPTLWASVGETTGGLPNSLKKLLLTAHIVDHGDVVSAQDTFVDCSNGRPVRITPPGIRALLHINS